MISFSSSFLSSFRTGEDMVLLTNHTYTTSSIPPLKHKATCIWAGIPPAIYARGNILYGTMAMLHRMVHEQNAISPDVILPADMFWC